VRGIAIARLVDGKTPEVYPRERERENITLFHEMVGEVEQAGRHKKLPS
jgi:threonine dehydrogenase-like Zn-dependent dehydrogenase